MIGLILLHLAILVFDTVEDWYWIIRRNRNIRHTRSALILTALVAISTAAYLAKLYMISGEPPLHLWNELAAWFILYPSIRWLWHDYGLNWLRGVDSEDLDTDGEQPHSDKLLISIYAKYNLPPRVVRVATFGVSLFLSSSVLLIF